MNSIFKDRIEAGQKLAKELERFRDEKPVILALPRGGLPIGYEVAKALQAPLDIILVRKIGTPGAPELAVGAVVDGENPELVLNEDVVRIHGVPESYIEQHAKQELGEIERRRKLYRADHPLVDVEGKTAIVVDDGIATGATVRAALKGVRKRNPETLILGVPVAPPETIESLKEEADEVICLEMPPNFRAISMHYGSFPQLQDEEVIDILRQADALPKKEMDNSDAGKQHKIA